MSRVLYTLQYVPGPGWKVGRDVREQPLEAHQAYMQDLYRRGDLLMGGPLLDNTGGLIILTVPEQGVAEQIMAHDPAVMTGIVTGTVHPWLPSLWHLPPTGYRNT